MAIYRLGTTNRKPVKKLALSLILAVQFTGQLFAQPGDKIDSLRNVVNNAKNDTNKVNALTALSNSLIQKSDYKEAGKYAEEELLLAQKSGYRKGVANSYSLIGVINEFLGNYTEALKNLQAALPIYQELKNEKEKAACYSNIGNVYFDLSDYNEALKYLQSALKLREEMGDKKGIAGSYNNIGNIYKNRGDYDNALKNYEASLKIKEEIGDKKGVAGTSNNVGDIYYFLGKYPEALRYSLNALKIFEEIGNKEGVADAYDAIGQIYEKQGNLEEALKSYMAALHIEEEIGDRLGMAESHNNIGGIYEKRDKFPEALKNYRISLKIYKTIGDSREAANVYHNIGNIYDCMGKREAALKNYQTALALHIKYEDKRGIASSNIDIGLVYLKLNEPDRAREYLNNGLAKARETGFKEAISEAYKSLSRLDSLQNNYKSAYLDYKQSTLYKDSMLNETNSKLIAEMKEKYESEKKEKEIVLLNKEKMIQTLEIKKQKQSRNYLIVGFVLISCISLFAYNNYRTRQQLKLQTLRNKIARDLHDDVGSTLSSIAIFSQMAQEQSKEVQPLLATIEDSSRKMLDAMADIVWTINPENDQFEKIIQRMRSFAYELLGAKKIDFEFIADDEVGKTKLSMEARKNLYLIFKEATNNMVKYAGADKALFTIKEEKKQLTMLIRDNGKGFDMSRASQGNGLKNMKKRAQEIGAELVIDSVVGGGTSISLRMAV